MNKKLSIKKVFVIFFILLFSLSTYALSPKIKLLLLHYRQNRDVRRKINSVYKLTKTKNQEVLRILLGDISHTHRDLNSAEGRSGIMDKVRMHIAIALREYKDLPKPNLQIYYNVLRRLIESGVVKPVIAETSITAATWVKKWDESYKKLFINSIMKRLNRITVWDGLIAIKIIKALKIINSKQAVKPLNFMLNMGFSIKIKKRINKALNYYTDR